MEAEPKAMTCMKRQRQPGPRGAFIEAIDLLRSYLEINPLQQHAAIRIAEIYEKDLSNYLAAAMEYEEILKQRLAPERWAWMAVHLSNLYSGRLDQPEKGHRTAQGSGGALSGYICCHEGGQTTQNDRRSLVGLTASLQRMRWQDA